MARRSKFITEKTRDAGNTGGETRLKMRAPSGTYHTVAHFKDEAIANNIARLLNARASSQMDEKEKARQYLDDQTELLPIAHDSMHPDRLKKFFTGHPNPEAFYLRAWRKLNSNKTGRQYLAHILCPPDRRALGFTMSPYSRRDAIVAASVVQWLGTNVGRGFVMEVERELKDATDKQWKLRAERSKRKPLPPPLPGQGGKATKKKLDATRKRLADLPKGTP